MEYGITVKLNGKEVDLELYPQNEGELLAVAAAITATAQASGQTSEIWEEGRDTLRRYDGESGEWIEER